MSDYFFEGLNNLSFKLFVTSKLYQRVELTLFIFYFLSIVVTGMFRVGCKKDTANFRDDLHNKRLLWHGTRPGHVLSILQNGLQIAPWGSITCGDRLGPVTIQFFTSMFVPNSNISRTFL